MRSRARDYEAIDARFDLPGGVPVTLAYDRNGKLVGKHQGEATRAEFEALARRALGE
jgi:YD repeat-containing protein